jgi:uncharacterized protein (DUF58 family)
LLIRLFAFVAAAALLIPVLPQLVWVVLAMTAGLALAAAGEALLLQRVRLTMDRSDEVALALDDHDTVPIRVSARAPRPLQLTVRQVWPDHVEPRSASLRAVCRPGEMASLEIPVRGIARGERTAEPAWASATLTGLMERVTPIGGPTTIHVLPNLKAVRRLHKRLNQFALRSLGARAAPKIGKGRDFDRLRDYVTDDDYRDIAWRASARHGRLIVREFRLDRSQEIVLCLDQGHRMAARVEQITRLDHAVNAAVLISYICNRMEDKIGILSFDTDVDKGLPTGRGTAHMRKITAYVTQLQPAYQHTDYLGLAAVLRRRLRHRTLIVIMTVLPEREERHDLLRAVQMLSAQHLPLFITLTDRDLRAAAQFLPSNREELARTLVARDLSLGRLELIRELRAHGALVVEATPEDAGIDAVNAYIDVKKRQLL